MLSISIHIDFNSGSIGSRDIRLLERVANTGSLSAAARDLGVSFRTAWNQLQRINAVFSAPVVQSILRGKQAGGTVLTPEGERLVRTFEVAERAAADVSRTHLPGFEALI